MVDNSQSPNPSIRRIHGIPCQPGTTPEMIEALPRLVAREKDIYVVAYPKAGKVISFKTTVYLASNHKSTLCIAFLIR